MAFTVGWPTGSSPVSVEEADAYFADRDVVAWTDATTGKEGALTRATDYVRTMFAARFDPLLFLAVDGVIVIPEALAQATFEYALVELRTPGGLAPAPVLDASGFSVVKTKKKVGPIESTFQVVGGEGAKPQTRRSFPIPDALIASLLVRSVATNRTTR